MDLQEANKYLLRGDRQKLSKALSLPNQYIQEVLRGSYKNQMAIDAIVKLAEERKKRGEDAVNKVLENK